MNKQELIESISHLPSDCSGPRPMIDKLTTLELVKLLDEPQKVTIPQFVADYIEFKKENDFHIYGAMRVIEDHYDKRVPEWFYEKNIETFARAWLDGYEVEEEKRYLVKMRGISSNICYLNRVGNKWIIAGINEHTGMNIYTKHTREELEQAGFGDVFNSPLFEVEEVEE